MRREWREARAGVRHLKLYEGARHSAATEWKRQGAPDRTIQAIPGHTDGPSVERYARLADQAVVEE
jgi:integrase